MRSFIIYLGSFYIILGSIFLLIPLIYLEFGRPKDFIRAGLNLFIGVFLIIKNRVFDNSTLIINLLFTVLIIFFSVEIFSSRWNQLTDKEKNKLTTLGEFKKNISKVREGINIGVVNFKNSINFLKIDKAIENNNKKKWVRKDKNDNIET
tara:strand:+ start:109 stop:558 length:450 start_codon:yes stop_codon:yes gene_type:complete